MKKIEFEYDVLDNFFPIRVAHRIYTFLLTCFVMVINGYGVAHIENVLVTLLCMWFE